jgi:hypothetical protein
MGRFGSCLDSGDGWVERGISSVDEQVLELHSVVSLVGGVALCDLASKPASSAAFHPLPFLVLGGA